MQLSKTLSLSATALISGLTIGLFANGNIHHQAFVTGIVGSMGTGITVYQLARKREDALDDSLRKERSNLQRAKADLVQARRVGEKLEEYKAYAEKLKPAYDSKTTELQNTIATVQRMKANCENLNLEAGNKTALIEKMQAQIDSLIAEIEKMEADYDAELKADTEAAIKGIRDRAMLEAELAEHERTEPIFQNYLKLDGLFKTLAERNTTLSSAYGETTESASQQINELTSEIASFTEHKEAIVNSYEQQVSILESQLKREFVQPLYLEAGYHPSFNAANAIIKILYQDMGIAVEGMGASISDDQECSFGILPSYSVNGEELAKQINRQSKNFSQALKLGGAPSAKYLPNFRAIEIKFRQAAKPVAEKAPRFAKDDFRAFVKALLLPNVPAIRVMGESGAGKSSVTRLIVSEAFRQSPFEIMLHDPQSDTEEDRWEVVKTSSDAKSTGKALKELAKNVEDKIKVNHPTFHVFDEVDGLCKADKDVKSGLLTIAKKTRHIKDLFALFMGQSPNVGRTGLEWADMGNFAAVYIGESALHAIEKSPVLNAIEGKLKPQYLEISDYCEAKNKAANLEGFEPECYRFALVNIPSKQPYFLLLPAFTDGIPGYRFDVDKMDGHDGQAMDTMDKPVHLEAETLSKSLDKMDGQSPIGVSGYPSICPKCGHNEFRPKGDRWVCRGCGKSGKRAL